MVGRPAVRPISDGRTPSFAREQSAGEEKRARGSDALGAVSMPGVSAMPEPRGWRTPGSCGVWSVTARPQPGNSR